MKLNFALDVPRGMHYLHDEGIVDRDLKTENIPVGKSRKMGRLVAKVADFGLARRVIESGVNGIDGHNNRNKRASKSGQKRDTVASSSHNNNTNADPSIVSTSTKDSPMIPNLL